MSYCFTPFLCLTAIVKSYWLGAGAYRHPGGHQAAAGLRFGMPIPAYIQALEFALGMDIVGGGVSRHAGRRNDPHAGALFQQGIDQIRFCAGLSKASQTIGKPENRETALPGVTRTVWISTVR